MVTEVVDLAPLHTCGRVYTGCVCVCVCTCVCLYVCARACESVSKSIMTNDKVKSVFPS